MSSGFLAQLPCIGEVQTLGWAGDDVAKSYMEHLLQRARHILPRRGWHVHVLKEFYPRGASLLGLNVNQGSEVCVRFRVPGSKTEFLPFHEVLCTTLHEFAHCRVSQHNRQFWNLYYELVRECEALEVSMVAQGVSLYPAYVSTASSTPSPSPSLRKAGKGRVLGGRAASTKDTTARAAGGVAVRGGRTRTVVVPSPRTASSAVASAPQQQQQPSTRATPTIHTLAGVAQPQLAPSSSLPSASPTSLNASVFTGTGHRLGGGPLPATSPTAEVLRHILASAAERRLRREQRRGVQTTVPLLPPPLDAHTATPTEDSVALPSEGSDGECDNEEGEPLPDAIPLSQEAIRRSAGEATPAAAAPGSWICPRCGYCNASTVPSCEVCSNVEDDEGDRGGGDPLIPPPDNADQSQDVSAAKVGTGKRTRSPGVTDGTLVIVDDLSSEDEAEGEGVHHATWSCSQCTFANSHNAEQCTVCGRRRKRTQPQSRFPPVDLAVVVISDDDDDDDTNAN